MYSQSSHLMLYILQLPLLQKGPTCSFQTKCFTSNSCSKDFAGWRPTDRKRLTPFHAECNSGSPWLTASFAQLFFDTIAQSMSCSGKNKVRWFPIALFVVFDTDFSFPPGGLPCRVWYHITPYSASWPECTGCQLTISLGWCGFNDAGHTHFSWQENYPLPTVCPILLLLSITGDTHVYLLLLITITGDT